MKVFRSDKADVRALPSRRHALATLAAFAGVAAVLAGCSSSPSSAPPTSASTSKARTTTLPASVAPSTTVPPKVYMSHSGKGDKNLSASGLPTKWMATWHFACEHPTRKATFTLDVGRAGGSLAKITSQTGLGGGGQRPYTSGGSYRFSVSTSCNWEVSAEAMPSA